MNLKEFQGKYYFKEYGISVPKSFLVKRGEDIPETDFEKVVVKAQTLSGKRKKSGLVKNSDRSGVGFVIQDIFNADDNIKEILVEEEINIKKEFYLSLTVDSASKDIICLFSEEGGIDVEDSENVKKFPIGDLENSGIRDDAILIIKKLYNLMKGIDAELVEINPLVLTKDGMVALDSKIIVDDNSLFRHSDLSKLREAQLSGIEKDAFFKGIEYVELDGNIGVIGNGAGLVMSTLDSLKLEGIAPGNFLDVGGGANSEKMSTALGIVMEKEPDKILINIFGGITRCDEIANGIVDFKNKNGLPIPVFVRLTGSKSDVAKKILEENGIKYFDNLNDAVKSMVNSNV